MNILKQCLIGGSLCVASALSAQSIIIVPDSVALTGDTGGFGGGALGLQGGTPNLGDYWFDGSGLSDASIVEAGDAVPAVFPTHTFGYNTDAVGGFMARVRNAAGTPAEAEFTFDLGGTFNISGMVLWNNGEGNSDTDRGIENAAVSYSTNGTDFTATGESWSFGEAAGSGDIVAQMDTLTTEIMGAKYLRLYVDTFDTNDNPIVSFAELRFVGTTAIPEPSMLSGLVGLLAAGVAFGRRRR